MRIFLPLLLLQIVAFSVDCKSQSADCESLAALLSSEDVIIHFRLSEMNDPVLFLLDKGMDFPECRMESWGNKRLVLLHDSTMTAALEKTQPYFLLKERCNYFIIMEYWRKKRTSHINILRPYSGLTYTAEIKKRKGRFVIFDAKKGVI